MTSKEKALELVQKYFKANHQPYGFKDAKQCALVAVEEVLKLENNNGYYFDGTNVTSISYWEDVKQEIEKL